MTTSLTPRGKGFDDLKGEWLHLRRILGATSKIATKWTANFTERRALRVDQIALIRRGGLQSPGNQGHTFPSG